MSVGLFASESVPLSAETIFHIGGISISNAMFAGVITAIAVLALLCAAAALSRTWPSSRFAFLCESLVDFVYGIAADSFGDSKKAAKHLPFLLTLFVFILISNLSGLLPGVGTITIGTESVPLLRAFTTDLNATLALAVLTIGSVQVYAIKELGVLGHLQHYFTNQPWKPVNMFVGINEVFTEFLRIVTLSMRLFGVIYAGEVLINAIGSLAGNFSWAATVPVYLLEIFFCLIQAYIFMMLTLVYLAIATSHPADENEHNEPAPATDVAVAA